VGALSKPVGVAAWEVAARVSWHLQRAVGPLRRGAFLAGAMVASAALGVLVFAHRTYGLLAAAGAAAVAVLAVDPVLLPIAAFPATLLIQRAGGSAAGSSVSLSDLVVAFALVVALPKVRWARAVMLRKALFPVAAYEVLVLPSVLANPNVHDSLEWAHRLMMLAGGLVVGWVVGASGRAKHAATAFLLGSSVVAVLAIEHAFTLHFHPAQWGAYQKNYIGTMMWMAAAVAHLNPPWIGVPRRFARFAKYLCVFGLLASQSKQAIFTLFVILVVLALRHPQLRHRSKLLLGSIVPLVAVAYFILSSEIAQLPTNRFNSLAVRESAYSLDLHVWSLSPVVGEGMRWFYLPHFAGYIQPPDIFVETLTETGVVGVVAILVLLGGAAVVFSKLPPSARAIALALVLGRAFEAIFDIYWVSAGGTLPWMVAGLALGAYDAGWLTNKHVPTPVASPATVPA
jgi:hypothetical protein